MNDTQTTIESSPRTAQQAGEFLKQHINGLLAKNIRKYTWKTYTSQPRRSSMLGSVVYLSPSDGNVAVIGDDFTIIKNGPSTFTIIDNALLDQSVAVGDKVSTSFYQLRRFDGTLADGSEDASIDGVKSFMLTGAKTMFPVKWPDRYLCVNAKFAGNYQEINNPYLRDLITQMEVLPVNGGMRHVVNVLVDANAKNLRFTDSSEDELISNPPAITVDVSTAKFTGTLSILYDRGMDTYAIKLTPTEGVECMIEEVYFDDLGKALTDLIDDSAWLKAKVTFIKRAKAPRQPSASTSLC